MNEAESGQSLVEMALVLPVLLFVLALAIQLIFYCHNMIELQRMAMVAGDRLTIENYKDARNYYWFNSLQGNFLTPKLHYKSEVVQRPFNGRSTVQSPGRLVLVWAESNLLPGFGFMSWLPKVSQEAYAEVLLEPPLPRDE